MKLIALVLAVLAATVGQAAAANPIQVENSRGGSTGWRGADARGGAIEGYTSEISVLPGDTVHFHVSTDPAEPYGITVYRLGWYGGAGGRPVASLGGAGARTYGLPPSPWLGAGWPVAGELKIPPDWVSGYYLARFELLAGEQAGRATSALFVVRAPPERRSTILVQVPVNTWEAYNPWGGKSFYNDNSIGGPSHRVSFDRPLPPGYVQTWEWEIQLVHFLEREGYDVSYQTDVDTHRDPGSLLTHRLVMVDGHGEYWSSRIRDAFDAARDAGTNLAFIGANIGYWQIRYEDGERTIVGYKSFPDPVTDPALQTVLFRALNPPRMECELMGVQYQGALRRSGDPPRDFAVNPAFLSDPWFSGTSFTASSTLPGLVGPEWDSIPLSLQPECMKPGLSVLFHFEGPGGTADAVRYVAPSGARVFSAGSLQFAWGLDDWAPPSRGLVYPAIPALQQFIRNALADLVTPAPPVLNARARRGSIMLVIAKGVDPRITTTVVSRDGTVVCKAPSQECVDVNLPGHRSYLYTAVNVDEWGQSAPTTAKVWLPNNRPLVAVRGPVTARIGTRADYVASATDRDGDTLRLRWLLDGRSVAAAGNRLTVTLARPGHHVIVAEARDGHGGRAAASLSVRVRP